MRIIENGTITSVDGFLASGVDANIKGKNTGKKDVAIIYSEDNCVAAGVFTLNKVRSKTIDVCLKNIKNPIKAIVANSGNANACVGEKGYDDALKMTEVVAENLKIESDKVLVSSTGVIGVILPMDRIENGIVKACQNLKKDGGDDAAHAIMTTDLVKKNIAVQFEINGEKIVIGGIAKGSGMIHPNMATMLGYITTNINIEQSIMQNLLKEITDKTFNMISVDRDTSTNDSLIILSNKRAKNRLIDSKEIEGYDLFKNALHYVMEYLAKSIAKDGEGATKLVEAYIKNAKTDEDAKKVGMAIITSPLVKTAIFGKDPNWGRIIAAIGYSEVSVNEGAIDIFIGDVKVCENGIGVLENEVKVKEELQKDEIIITVDLKLGASSAKVWGCDLSYDYVKINADYRS
ncbi:MAG: bifunctional glutamate N-acetyltransferase/amino-acid acetyltransferase ArgJ [Fusobacteria bacterium]|nr:bifunctional glutamate N-acetyltransferase/amino-acid acetyltransferase ArgJ [Fusobacteriota bacterium]